MNWNKSYQTFLTVWNDPERPFKKHLKILKNKPVSKCKECDDFTQRICAAATGTEAQRKQLKILKAERRRHWLEVKTERFQYHKKRELARKYPALYLSLIIDGMDQKKTNFTVDTGANGKRDGDNDDYCVPSRVVGVLAHGIGNFSFISPSNVPHDSNTTWTALLRTIAEIKAAQGFLPPNLFIQMDNTNADNKTKVTLAMCERLVASGMFKTVELGFLPVGHTHEDIDQSFSVLAKALQKRPAFDFEGLRATCASAN